MLSKTRARWTCAILTVTFLVRPAAAQLPAFPGAEGFGATASGGRGGEVYHVTHLGDTGPGSLRDAVSAGPRTVVFDVGGYVELKSVLRIAGDVTIAGQTAPGDGIGTRNYEVSFSGARNVIVRHVRFRLGDTAGQEARSAVVMTGSNKVILDHCSIQLGQWDALQLIGASNVTVQHCIIGPSLGRQLGCLCASEDVTFHHNLFINTFHAVKARGKVQLVNNVVYNWQHDAFMDAPAASGTSRFDLVGNYFIAGPATERTDPISGGNPATRLYATGNYVDRNRDGKLNGTLLADADFKPMTVETTANAAPSIAVTSESADVAYRKVVDGAGCSLQRDALDAQLVADLTSLGKTGKLVSQSASLPKLRGGAAPKDTDGDGIPDAWELTHNLDPKNPADRNTLDKSGYTMFEVYLNSLADQATIAGSNTFTLAVTPGVVQAKAGAKAKLTVTATRRGYDGTITLELRNLPTGVTGGLASLAPGQTTVDIPLTTIKGAAGNRSDVVVHGTQANGKGAVNSPSFTVQTQGTNFTLKLTPGNVKLKAGTKATVQVTVDRKDYTGAINVQLQGLPAHVKAGAATIPAGQNSVSIDLTADGKANGTGTVIARGTVGGQHHDSPSVNVVVTKK